MDVNEILRRMYPQADEVTDYVVQDERIIYWNEATLGPRPTDQQLQDAWIPALKAQKIAEVRRRVVTEADAVMPVWEFIYITRARITDSRTTTLEAIAKKGRDMEAYINHSQRTEAELLAVSWETW
jgi:hypothetical protein